MKELRRVWRAETKHGGALPAYTRQVIGVRVEGLILVALPYGGSL